MFDLKAIPCPMATLPFAEPTHFRLASAQQAGYVILQVLLLTPQQRRCELIAGAATSAARASAKTTSSSSDQHSLASMSPQKGTASWLA